MVKTKLWSNMKYACNKAMVKKNYGQSINMVETKLWL